MSEKTLREAQGEQCFWVNNGPVLKNLPELRTALEAMSTQTFDYHTKKNGNHFADWIEWVLGSKALAKKIIGFKTKRGCIKAIDKFLAE